MPPFYRSYGKVIDLLAYRSPAHRRGWYIRSFTRVGWLIKSRIVLRMNPAMVCVTVNRRWVQVGRWTIPQYRGYWTNAPAQEYLLPSALGQRLKDPLLS